MYHLSAVFELCTPCVELEFQPLSSYVMNSVIKFTTNDFWQARHLFYLEINIWILTGVLKPCWFFWSSHFQHTATENKKNMMRVYLLLVCLLPLLMCQAEAAPEPRDRLGVQPVKVVNGVRGMKQCSNKKKIPGFCCFLLVFLLCVWQ